MGLVGCFLSNQCVLYIFILLTFLTHQYISFIIQIQIISQKISMDHLKNIRHVTSPLQSANSPNFASESRESVVVGRNSAFGFGSAIEPTRLDFKTSKVESKFANISMIQSQVGSSSTNNAFYSVKNSTVNDKIGSSSRINIDPMKDSTIAYIKTFSRGMGALSEDRLKAISQNFLRLYGTDREITQNGLRNIQRQAHSNQQFEQTSQTVKGLIQVLDSNRDQRITEEDIMVAARRYLSFEKKQIIYTPMVEERLAVARRLFKQFDVERKGYLTEKQVPNLLSQTYRCLGKTFTATPQDVKSWMKLTDGDNDGHVTLPEYQQSIIRALKKQGVRIYEQ